MSVPLGTKDPVGKYFFGTQTRKNTQYTTESLFWNSFRSRERKHITIARPFWVVARMGGGTLQAGQIAVCRVRPEREGSAANVSAKKIIPGKKKGLIGAASVVGATPGGGGEAAKIKNSLRREKQRLAKEQVEREAVEAEERKKAEEKAKQEANAADPEKRAKKIKQVLKQIEDIKKKVGASGAEMNEDQKKKVETEEGLRTELAALGL